MAGKNQLLKNRRSSNGISRLPVKPGVRVLLVADIASNGAEALKDYLEKDDIFCAERQAHSIKGAAANLSGEALRAIVFEMETCGKNCDLPAMRMRMAALELQFARLKNALSKELQCASDSERAGKNLIGRTPNREQVVGR